MIEITWQAAGVLSGIILGVGGVLVGYIKSVAGQASKIAEEAKQDATEAHKRLDTHIHETFLYREGVSQKYVTLEAMRAVEKNFVDAINKLTERIDRVLSGK